MTILEDDTTYKINQNLEHTRALAIPLTSIYAQGASATEFFFSLLTAIILVMEGSYKFFKLYHQAYELSFTIHIPE